MKKISLILFALGLLSLASCKKDRTCNCTIIEAVGNSSDVKTTSTTFTKISKSDAKNACANSSFSDTENGHTTFDKTTCKLS